MSETTAPGLCFVGAGSLGQAFAALLASNGQAVTLVATPVTATHLLAGGSIRVKGVVAVEVSVAPAPAPPGTVGVTADPGRIPAGAGVIFMTKGHQLVETIAAACAVWPAAGDETAWVAGVQNGVVKDDLLAAAFGSERVLLAATIFGAQRLTDGEITVASLGRTYFGERGGGISARVGAVVETLQAAEIPAEAPADIQSVLWSKLCNAAGVFGVSVLTRTTSPQLFNDPDLLRAYLGLIRETAAVGAAFGILVGDHANFPPMRTFLERADDETIATITTPLPGTPDPRTGSLSSMAQDLLAGRPMEVEAVFGDLVERADHAGIPVPRLTLVRDLLRGLDRVTR
jgi:2-dehydropantoate 2-reductase